MPPQPDGFLKFHFRDLEDEIDALASLAGDFLDASARHILPQYKSQLESIRTNPSDQGRVWQIAPQTPLLTRLSDGAYEASGRKGGLQVRGTLSTIWEVQHPVKKGAQKKPSNDFFLIGKASTMLRVVTANAADEEIAMWRTEVGDSKSPGCHFHVQVRGHDENPPFPKALSVPRLPTLAVTAMDALDFLLGELFQDDWRAESAKKSTQLGRLRSIQQNRLISLLDWQKTVLESGSQSPWANLKASKPPGLLFARQ